VSAAKATLEAHIRQLAVELAPAGITDNATLARRYRHQRVAADSRLREDHGSLLAACGK